MRDVGYIRYMHLHIYNIAIMKTFKSRTSLNEKLFDLFQNFLYDVNV